MLAEMRKSGSSLTSEDTIDTRMRLVITNGLLDPTFNSFLDAMGEYEDLNNVLANPIDERERAHTYKKMICDVSKEIEKRNEIPSSIINPRVGSGGDRRESWLPGLTQWSSGQLVALGSVIDRRLQLT